MLYRFLFVLLTLTIAGCQTAEVYHFVHEETESDRKSLQWSKSDPQLISELAGTKLPYFVIDFHSFWPGYSATAYMYVVQRADKLIRLRSITVESSETGEVHRSLINGEVSVKLLENGYRLYRYRVLDMRSSDQFSDVNSLRVTLKWQDQEETDRSTTFTLKKQTKNEVVWPT